jgi:hypothetical protein
MRIKNFKLFENKQGFIDENYIKDLFIELLDNGFNYTSYNHRNIMGKYFFEFKKYFTESELDYVDNNHVYGYSNLDKIKEEINSSIEVIKESRERLLTMGYTLAFELEFNFSTTAMITIVCHMHHKKYDE